MNEPLQGAPIEPAPVPEPYKDRSVGLKIFGVLTILLGCLAALMVLLMVAQTALAGTAAAPAPTLSSLLAVICIYGIVAVGLVWLGVGSIMSRRWARALLLIFSWSWLVVGLLTMVFMAFVMPSILANIPTGGKAGQPGLPPGAAGIVMVVTFLILGVIFVLMPVVWVLFYGSRHVKATCDASDPVIRWTDKCPLPVLAVCLWTITSAPMMLIMPLSGHFVMPFFGTFLTGFSSGIFCLAIAVIWGYAGWSLFKLEPRGWWLILIGGCVFVLSSFLTFARHDVVEMYHLMDYPQAQIDQIQKMGMFAGNRMMWMMTLSMAPFLGYLFFIKKFLRRQP